MMNLLGSIFAKTIAALFGEWSRDRSNRKLGAANLAAETAEATLENMRKADAVDRTLFGPDGADPEWLSRVRRDAGINDS